MPAKTKYKLVTDRMRQDLREALARGETAFHTDLQATKHYGVSRITVRRAFAQLEAEGMVERVRGKGTRILQNPERRIRFVGFMGMCLVESGMEPLLIRGAEQTLVAQGANLVICNMENDPARAMQYAERLVQAGIDGVLFVPMLREPRENEALLDFFARNATPAVQIARFVEARADDAPGVVCDNHAGGRQAAEHLLSLGHRRIAFFHSFPWGHCSAMELRHAGYAEALGAAGIEPDPQLAASCRMGELPLLLRRWLALPDPPTAVFVDNDVALAHFVETCHAMGLRIPDDLSLVGFDDISRLSIPVPQTTIHVPYREIGQMAASLLVDIIRDGGSRGNRPRKTVVPVEIAIRRTTGMHPAYARASAPA